MIKLLSLVSILLKLKNKINDRKGNRILVRSNFIIVKKWVIILFNILIKNQKTSFGYGNFFINNSSQKKGYSCRISLF